MNPLVGPKATAKGGKQARARVAGRPRKHDRYVRGRKIISAGEDPIKNVYGILKSKGSTDDWIRDIRGDPDVVGTGAATRKKPIEEAWWPDGGATMKAVVSEKGQVTIPKKLRDGLGIRGGQVLEFSEERGRLVAAKAKTHDPDQVYGMFKHLGKRTDEIMRELRGEPDAV